jgi:propanol-preferring alcohol dehydrogenase
MVGLFGGVAPWPLPLIPMKAATISGSYTGNLTETKELLDLARKGVVPNIPIQRRPLSNASEALEDLKGGRVVGRVVLMP